MLKDRWQHNKPWREGPTTAALAHLLNVEFKTEMTPKPDCYAKSSGAFATLESAGWNSNAGRHAVCFMRHNPTRPRLYDHR
jgi:hypothetical protein